MTRLIQLLRKTPNIYSRESSTLKGYTIQASKLYMHIGLCESTCCQIFEFLLNRYINYHLINHLNKLL